MYSECRWNVAECGWDVAECGWDVAECGWDVAECGWDAAECGWDACGVWMRCSQVWMRCSRVWMRCTRVARASDSQCRSRNCIGFDPSILRHSGIWGAADEAVLNKVHTFKKSKKNLFSDTLDRRSIRSWSRCSSRALPYSSPTTRSKADLT